MAENMIWSGYTTQQKKGVCVCVKRSVLSVRATPFNVWDGTLGEGQVPFCSAGDFPKLKNDLPLHLDTNNHADDIDDMWGCLKIG